MCQASAPDDPAQFLKPLVKPGNVLLRAVRSGPQDRKWTENRTEPDQLGLDRRSWSFQFRRRRTDVLVL